MRQQNNAYLRQSRIIVIAMSSLFKRLFWKKKKSDSKNLKDEDIPKWAQYFKSLDENQSSGLRKTLNVLKASDSDNADLMHDFIDAGLEINDLKKAIKIVNAYGGAITKGTELNKIIVESFQNKSPEQHLEALKKKGKYFYALQNKFDVSLLPFDKKTAADPFYRTT